VQDHLDNHPPLAVNEPDRSTFEAADRDDLAQLVN
jgi:hypothetical protein